MTSARDKLRAVAATRAARVSTGVVAGLILIVLTIWVLPELLNPATNLDPDSKLRIETLLSAKNATRASLVALLVALVGIGTFLYTIRSYRLARTGQVTDRYTKAVGQLADAKPQVRVGGVYALERIARDSPRDRRAVVDVLLAHIRDARGITDSSAPSSAVALDVSAAAQVLGRLDRTDLPALDLRRIDLRRVDLTNADFSGCHLEGSNLEGAVLVGATLRRTFLDDASLTGANLSSADLFQADLAGAALSGANVYLTKIHPAQLSAEQKKAVRNWDTAIPYTGAGGTVAPMVTRPDGVDADTPPLNSGD
jgi:hypothetical protein